MNGMNMMNEYFLGNEGLDCLPFGLLNFVTTNLSNNSKSS